MSAHPLIISCSNCDYTFSTLSRVVHKYKINNETLHMITSCAWCSVCREIVLSERIPTLEDVANLHKRVLFLDASIEKQISENKKDHPVLSLINKRIYDREGVLSGLEMEKDAIQYEIDRILQLAVNIDINRRSRCLECGSENIVLVDIFRYKLSYPPRDGDLPVNIGMKHPVCGGDLRIGYSPLRIFMGKFETKYYSKDGNLLY